MSQQYNKKAGAQIFQVGQNDGLQIPVEHREKCDDKYIVCMVVQQEPHHSYRLRCEHGVIQGLIRTDQLVPWKPAHTFSFKAADGVSAHKALPIPTAARMTTHANSQHDVCAKVDARLCIAVAAKQCTARCHVGTKCRNWGHH